MNQLNLHANSTSDFTEFNAYSDFAIALAWPDTTARADERWFMALRQMGILKNLNFKVGHAAIILIERQSGQALYYDFGRYVTPRGNGRPRSRETDPKLAIHTICRFRENSDDEHPIVNLDELIYELESNKVATHGDGILYFSVAPQVSFVRAREAADWMTLKGNVRYSAFAPGNNNCSRFVEKVMVAGLLPGTDAAWHVQYPETFVASPMSNVINANRHHLVGTCQDRQIAYRRIGRLESLRYFISQTSDNFSKRKAALLPPDDRLGRIGQPTALPTTIPPDSQWLGGIGEGGWHHLKSEANALYELTKYDHSGEPEFRVFVRDVHQSGFDGHAPFRFIYDTHAMLATVEQNGIIHRLEAVSLGVTVVVAPATMPPLQHDTPRSGLEAATKPERGYAASETQRDFNFTSTSVTQSVL